MSSVIKNLRHGGLDTIYLCNGSTTLYLEKWPVLFPYQSAVDLCNLSLSSITGVNLSLLSRVMSSRLSRGTYNGGLLSTEAGTLARVVADATITLAGYVHQSMLLNVTLLPSLFICVTSILATCFTYNSLY